MGAVGLMMCFGWVFGVGLLWFRSVIDVIINLRWFASAQMVNVVVLPLVMYIVIPVVSATMFFRTFFNVVGINDAELTRPTWATYQIIFARAEMYEIMFFVALWLAFTSKVVNTFVFFAR